ncbi:hypothetical protein [Halodesulfovibrio sp.]|jgi:hypothetical protein|uniref:hypothetical protein n=1 Tax=Halodesulfovibrio sp. TaxID=1912772 RepID=UPI0025D1D356|nr:hypothetical protein [Halodesulfovibrio sp.]MCT4533707.1 hypothetical protein [Halodesulfovibrio sp.]
MLTAALLAMGFLLSPRAFMISGSGIGLAGNWYFLIVALLFTTHLVTIPPQTVSNEKQYSDALKSFGYGVRFFPLAFFACSILGIAGYAFNEVFVYWFPNFLFSFIILACSFLTAILPASKAQKLQLASIILVLIGITVLSLAALWATPPNANSPDFFAPYGASPFSDGLLLMAPLLLGYELYTPPSSSNGTSRKSYALALGLTVVFLSIFAYASLCVSGSEKLADSTVPYMIGARKILGQTGRYIMGAIIILGSYAAFMSTLLFLKKPFDKFIVSSPSTKEANHRLSKKVIAAAIPTLTVSVLLLRGYAGEPITESYIAGGFSLWFLFYGLSAAGSIKSTHSILQKVGTSFGILSCFYLAYVVLQLSEAPVKGLSVATCGTLAIAVLTFCGRKRLLP